MNLERLDSPRSPAHQQLVLAQKGAEARGVRRRSPCAALAREESAPRHLRGNLRRIPLCAPFGNPAASLRERPVGFASPPRDGFAFSLAATYKVPRKIRI